LIQLGDPRPIKVGIFFLFFVKLIEERSMRIKKDRSNKNEQIEFFKKKILKLPPRKILGQITLNTLTM
jgi:hypothetical protein